MASRKSWLWGFAFLLIIVLFLLADVVRVEMQVRHAADQVNLGDSAADVKQQLAGPHLGVLVEGLENELPSSASLYLENFYGHAPEWLLLRGREAFDRLRGRGAGDAFFATVDWYKAHSAAVRIDFEDGKAARVARRRFGGEWETVKSKPGWVGDPWLELLDFDPSDDTADNVQLGTRGPDLTADEDDEGAFEPLPDEVAPSEGRAGSTGGGGGEDGAGAEPGQDAQE